MAVDQVRTSVFPKPAAQDSLALRQCFEAVHAESCPYHFNFHMHTVCSDGQLKPEELIEQAIELGLKGLAITDHHSVEGYRQAQQWLNTWQQASPDQERTIPHLWTGVEISADLLDTEVHILAYAFDPDHPALSPYLQGKSPWGCEAWAERVIEAIHDAGGVAVLAHPVRYRRSAEELIAAAVHLGIDGVETYYAYGNPNPWQPSQKETQQVRELSEQFKLLNTCGTDTHGRNLLRRI